MPRVRFGKVHVFNSLYAAARGTACIEVGVDCNIDSENNVFRGVSNAVDSSHPTARALSNRSETKVPTRIGVARRSFLGMPTAVSGIGGNGGRGAALADPFSYARSCRCGWA